MTDRLYTDCLNRMYRLRRFGIKLGLDLIARILEHLGAPHKQYNCIHIAGTNGKGSVAAYLSSILAKAGYTTGRYTSPHLERFNERICINDHPISDELVVDEFLRIDNIGGLEREPTFFEFATAMALDVFARQNVQWAVIETGMGGRLDATNVITPRVSVITNISLEHKTYLGTSIAAIAFEKAGIIKAGVPLVSGARQPSARKVIESKAAEQKADVYFRGRDYHVRRVSGSQKFIYHGIATTRHNLETPLVGRHQLENASHALAACELLNAAGLAAIKEDAICAGLLDTRWPGRLEIVNRRPMIILDGAHNLAAARNLAAHMTQNFAKSQITMVVGILDDKPFKAILRRLAGCCRQLILTQPCIDRALPAQKLDQTAAAFCSNRLIKPTVTQAVDYVLQHCNTDEIICFAGSLYVVGEARSALIRHFSKQGAQKISNDT